jgi:hypothetical protein
MNNYYDRDGKPMPDWYASDQRKAQVVNRLGKPARDA